MLINTIANSSFAEPIALEAEQILSDFSEHILLSVALKYGKSSDEYQMAGGTRKFDRRGQVRGVTLENAS